MCRTLMICAILLAPAVASADLPSQAGEPYRLVVCLGFADDPIFTRFFINSVERQVHDQLANYFGALADVQVVTGHPLLERSRGGGLARLELTAQDFADGLVEGKVFLMALAFRDGIYQLEWRQVDGDVDRLGPVYRQTTPDRQWLAKAICLAVRNDFAPVANVKPGSDGSTATLDFRGADRSDRLASCLESGCVLAPYWVLNQQDGSQTCAPIPHTVLVIGEGTEWTKASVVTGLASPWKKTARVAGFRAIKLTTQTGRFRLRLINSEDGSPVQSGNVYASSKGFDETTDADRLPDPDREGFVVADRDFRDLAYVTVRHTSTFKLLIPITEAWCESELRIPVDQRAGRRADWQRQLRYCVQDLQVLEMMVDQCVREVNELNGNKRYEEAEKRVAAAIEAIRPMVAAADSSLFEVESEAKEIQMSNDRMLAWARDQLDELHDRQAQLGQLAGNLRDTIDKIDAQSRAKVLVDLAGQAEQAGEIDDAIEKYGLALEEWSDMPQVRQKLNQLREDWQIRSPEHERARRFVYDTYAKAGADQVEPLLLQAREAFRVLAGVDDYLTVEKLAKINGKHVSELSEIVGLLGARSGEADRAEFERYQKLAEEVLDFQAQVVEYGTTRTAPSPPSTTPEPPAEEEPDAKPPEPKTPEEEAPEPPGPMSDPPGTSPGPPPLDGDEEEPPLES